MLISIDQSLTSSGITRVLADGSIFAFRVKTTPDQPWFDRVDAIVQKLRYVASPQFFADIGRPEEPLVAAAMENYAFSGQKGFTLGEVGGACKYELLKHKVPVYAIVASHWKMFIFKNGKASKKEARDAFAKRFGIHFDNLDMSDSACMAMLLFTFYKHKLNNVPITAYEANLFTRMGLLDGSRDLRNARIKAPAKPRGSRSRSKNDADKSAVGDVPEIPH